MHIRLQYLLGFAACATIAVWSGFSFGAAPVRAQTASVTIVDFAFQPASLTVAAGTTVTWTNTGQAPHTSTSDTGAWDSGTISPGSSYSHTFAQAGTFTYHCSIHPFMKATIVVQAASSATATSGPSTTATTGATSPAATATSIPQSAIPAPAAGGTRAHMGPMRTVARQAWLGFYDGHKDTYLNSDVSSRTEAKAMGVNVAPALARMVATSPSIYLVVGRAVPQQLAVFGSEPGEADYSPIWREVDVRWNAGVKPILPVRDDQIKALARAGKLTVRSTHIALNCPIIKVNG